MELSLTNNLNNELEQKQNNFLNNIFGKAINNGIDIGIRCLLPDYLEDTIIDLKNNLLNYGLKDEISKTIQTVINTGKSAIGIFTGNFENVNQINDVIKSGGIIDSVSSLLDDVINKVRKSGKINNTVLSIVKNGKNAILNNVEKNINSTINNQFSNSKYLEKYMNNWKEYFNNKDFSGMEKEYQKMKIKLKELIPLENTIDNARNIETLHNLIKNNGQNFNLSTDELELANNLSA